MTDENQDLMDHVSDVEMTDDDDQQTEYDTEQIADDESQESPTDELGFSFDDDDSDPFRGQEAPKWVKETREENRQLKRQLKQLQAEKQANQEMTLREKPTLAEHGYDEVAYESDLEKWYQESQSHQQRQQAEQAKIQKYDENYKASVNGMRTKASDYDDVELMVAEALSINQQALIKVTLDNPASMIYALGKSPNKLSQLAELDEIQFIKQLAVMELQMKDSQSRNLNKPKPKEHELIGSTHNDSVLAKLEAESAKTGDRSKILAYRKQLKNRK